MAVDRGRRRRGWWRRNAMRLSVAVALAIAAWLHLDLWLHGYSEMATVGALFLLDVAAGVVLAVAVLAWRHWLSLAGAIAFGAATLGAFLLSATVGLFEISPGGQAWGAYEVIAAVVEAWCVLGGGWQLAAERRG